MAARHLCNLTSTFTATCEGQLGLVSCESMLTSSIFFLPRSWCCTGGCLCFQATGRERERRLDVFQAHCCKQSALLRSSIIHLLTTHLTLSCLSVLLILIVCPLSIYSSLLLTPPLIHSGPGPLFSHICRALPRFSYFGASLQQNHYPAPVNAPLPAIVFAACHALSTLQTHLGAYRKRWGPTGEALSVQVFHYKRFLLASLSIKHSFITRAQLKRYTHI